MIVTAQAIVAMVRAGKHRLVKANGAKSYKLERLHNGEWLVGVRVNTLSGRAAARQLTAQVGNHLTTWTK